MASLKHKLARIAMPAPKGPFVNRNELSKIVQTAVSFQIRTLREQAPVHLGVIPYRSRKKLMLSFSLETAMQQIVDCRVMSQR